MSEIMIARNRSSLISVYTKAVSDTSEDNIQHSLAFSLSFFNLKGTSSNSLFCYFTLFVFKLNWRVKVTASRWRGGKPLPRRDSRLFRNYKGIPAISSK